MLSEQHLRQEVLRTLDELPREKLVEVLDFARFLQMQGAKEGIPEVQPQASAKLTMATTATKVAPRPQVAAPKLFLQMRELPQQLVGCLALQPLDHPTDGYLRGNRHEQRQMIFGHVALHDRYCMLTADLANPVAHPQGHFAGQRWTAILRGPDQMQMDFKNRVGTTPILFHAAKLNQTTRHWDTHAASCVITAGVA